MKPINNKIQIKIDKPTAGSLDISSKATAVECGEVVAIAEEVSRFKVGDKILFKSWDCDVISHEGEIYYFIRADSEGICATI